MAVGTPQEIWAGRTGSKDQRGARQYARAFRLQTTSTLDGPLAVMQAWGLPRINDIYTEANGTTTDTGARCVRVEPSQDQDDPQVWVVTCEYSSELEQQDTTQENPLDRAAEFTGGFSVFQRPAEQDLRGNAHVNSAGEKFDPPIEVEDVRHEFTIKRNLQTINFVQLGEFTNAINSRPFLGFSEKTLRISGINYANRTENRINFWDLSVTFQFRSPISPAQAIGAAVLGGAAAAGAVAVAAQTGWNPTRVLDQGYYEFYAPLTAPVLIRDSSGEALSAPTLLDGTGRKLAQGAKPAYREFYHYLEKDFGELNLV